MTDKITEQLVRYTFAGDKSCWYVGVKGKEPEWAEDIEDYQPEAPTQDQWQPIETAPKDGRQFLAFFPDRKDDPFQCAMVVWCDDDPTETAIWSADGREVTKFATHWMPLPAPPSPDGAQVIVERIDDE